MKFEPGATFAQWTPAGWCPAEGKDGIEVLPKFRPGCFDRQLGRVIPFLHECGAALAMVRVEGYRCADDGSGAWFRFRVVAVTEGGTHEH